jgi:hypothetical protein
MESWEVWSAGDSPIRCLNNTQDLTAIIDRPETCYSEMIENGAAKKAHAYIIASNDMQFLVEYVL